MPPHVRPPTGTDYEIPVSRLVEATGQSTGGLLGVLVPRPPQTLSWRQVVGPKTHIPEPILRDGGLSGAVYSR